MLLRGEEDPQVDAALQNVAHTLILWGRWLDSKFKAGTDVTAKTMRSE